MKIHLTVRALPRTLLFHDWTEALALWRRLCLAFPEARAICLMPNHPHVVTEAAPDARRRLAGVMSGYARWRGARRGQDAACWAALPPVEELPDPKHERRTERYTLLNPCRGDLTTDPLAWPLSTYRDRVGLGDPVKRSRDPARLHAHVSADPTVSLVGTELPGVQAGRAGLKDVEIAVGAILRLQPGELRGDARARRLMVRAAWFFENTHVPTLAEWVGVDRATAYRLRGPEPTRRSIEADPWLSSVLRVVGDPRFPSLVLPPGASGARWEHWAQGPGRERG